MHPWNRHCCCGVTTIDLVSMKLCGFCGYPLSVISVLSHQTVVGRIILFNSPTHTILIIPAKIAPISYTATHRLTKIDDYYICLFLLGLSLAIVKLSPQVPTTASQVICAPRLTVLRHRRHCWFILFHSLLFSCALTQSFWALRQ